MLMATVRKNGGRSSSKPALVRVSCWKTPYLKTSNKGFVCRLFG